MRPITTVATARPEVGVLVDAPGERAARRSRARSPPTACTSRSRSTSAPSVADLSVLSYGDQAVPRLPNGGLVRWLQTRAQLHRLLRSMGIGRHFLYASNGPSVGQWWLAHGAGGRLIAGAVRLDDNDDSLGRLHAGEVVELTMTSSTDVPALLDKLHASCSPIISRPSPSAG